MTEEKMVGWHHWLNGHEFEQTLGDGKGQGRLSCCSPRGHKELDIRKAELMLSLVVLQKTLESPLNCKEIKPVNPKGNQP